MESDYLLNGLQKVRKTMSNTLWRYITETINGEMTEEEHEKGKRESE